MDKTLAIVMVAGIFSVLVIFFFTRFLGKGKLKVKVPLGGEVSAEGSNTLPPSTTPAGVKIRDAEAGKDVRAQSSGVGGVDLEKVKAAGRIEATHSPGDLPPKK
jgi:hypothetical protein